MQEAFGHVESIVLKVVGCHSYLSDNLFLGCMQLHGGQTFVAEPFQFLMDQFDAKIRIFMLQPK